MLILVVLINTFSNKCCLFYKAQSYFNKKIIDD